MRITCPECGTQYEIEPDLVPPAGRDVQCSACETIWTVHPDQDQPAAPETASAPGADDGEDDGEDAPAAPPAGARPRPKVDENTRRILLEEARREAQERRRREAGAPADKAPADAAPTPGSDAAPEPEEQEQEQEQEQEDAPSDPPPQPSAVPVAGLREDRSPGHTASFGGAGPSLGPAVPVGERQEPARPRTDLLPDVEESGATLIRPGAARRSPDPVPPEPQRGATGSFLSGFTFVLVLAFLIVGIDLAAPSLAQRIPAIEDELAAFVGLVNDLRVQVDLTLQSLARAVSGTGA